MKRHICILLLLSMLCGTCASCASNTTTAEDESTAQTDAPVTETETTEADLYAAMLAEVPTGDYGGYDFQMLNNESNFAYTLMTAEELTGESINDAVYNRNTTVSDKLNITITENMISYGKVTEEMKACITAGDDTYSCFWNESHFVAPFALRGELLNVNDMTAIDLEKPWWNGSALEEISFGDYQYFLVGDLHLMFKESYWMCGFNKDIVDENGLEDPYALVREGDWTMDTMQEYMRTVAQDLDGNGEINLGDRFGVTCYIGCTHAFVIAADEAYIERDESGVPQIKTPDDRFYAVYEKLVSLLYAPEADYVCLDGKTKGLEPDEWHEVFSSGHALFYLEPVGSLKKLRDMDAEFGIVPFPKYNTEQQDYVTYIAGYAAFCGVPITTSDMERTGVILENLCAQSYGELRNAYVETTLNFKYIRDQESVEMLNLILESGRFSLTDTLGVSTPPSTYLQNATAGKAELASAYAKIIDAAKKLLSENIQKLMKAE